MTEKQFENQVKQFLKHNNIYYVKNWGGGYTKAGIPDLFICLKGKFVAVELKNETGKPTPLQLYNIEQIKNSGGQAFILRPDEFEKFRKEVLEIVQLQ